MFNLTFYFFHFYHSYLTESTYLHNIDIIAGDLFY